MELKLERTYFSSERPDKKLEVAHICIPPFVASTRYVTSQFQREKNVGLINERDYFYRKVEKSIQMSLKVCRDQWIHIPRIRDRKVFRCCWFHLYRLVKARGGIFYRGMTSHDKES